VIAATPFLTFNGNCRDAMKFYESCFDGELFLMTVGEAPGDFPVEAKDLVMHSTLRNSRAVSGVLIAAADSWAGAPYHPGNNFSVLLEFDDLEENQRVFDALGQAGNVTMPLQDMFWGARFGMLTDQFGVQWMFNCALPKLD
jgi:PhnB protein